MRLVIQRVARAAVRVNDAVVGAIGPGLLVLLAVGPEDSEADADWLAGKTARLRIFEDETGKMNRSVQEVGGSCLVVSQFTLYGDCKKGNRPSFIYAADPQQAEALYAYYVEQLAARGLQVATGTFQADMEVDLINDGPVTLILESTAGVRG